MSIHLVWSLRVHMLPNSTAWLLAFISVLWHLVPFAIAIHGQICSWEVMLALDSRQPIELELRPRTLATGQASRHRGLATRQARLHATPRLRQARLHAMHSSRQDKLHRASSNRPTRPWMQPSPTLIRLSRWLVSMEQWQLTRLVSLAALPRLREATL